MLINMDRSALRKRARELRKSGKTYTEIGKLLERDIPKSTLSNWCKGVLLPRSYLDRVAKLNCQNLQIARKVALRVNRLKRKKFLEDLRMMNVDISRMIKDDSVGMVALAMLCLGEASKYKSKHRQFSLGSSDPRIIIIFLSLLERIKGFDLEKMRCTVQCRADQDTKKLEEYWMEITAVPRRLFYSARIDPRTMGRPTENKNYMGVLVVDYYDRKVQLMLEILADLIYNRLRKFRAHSSVG